MFTITENFVRQYAKNYHLLGQQRKSRLEQFISDKETGVTGDSFTAETVDKSEANDVVTRHGDTPIQNQEHGRRVAFMQDKDWGELVDKLDKIKLLADPTSVTVQNMIAALNRKKDGVIIAAATGVAATGNLGTGTQALPSAQIIVHGGTGLTLAKLRTAKKQLDNDEQNDEAFFEMMGQQMTQTQPFGQYANAAYVLAVTADQIDNLLGDTTITSADYNSVKALVAGAINTFMGFWFVRLPKTGASALAKSGTTRTCFAFSPRALKYGVGVDVDPQIAVRPDKKFSVQVYGQVSVGCVRKEDKGVVAIECTES